MIFIGDPSVPFFLLFLLLHLLQTQFILFLLQLVLIELLIFFHLLSFEVKSREFIHLLLLQTQKNQKILTFNFSRLSFFFWSASSSLFLPLNSLVFKPHGLLRFDLFQVGDLFVDQLLFGRLLPLENHPSMVFYFCLPLIPLLDVYLDFFVLLFLLELL